METRLTAFLPSIQDINKRREKYWLPLADACEKLLMKIQKSLHDQTTTKLLPLLREILGQDEDPRENSIIFARRAVTAQIKQAWTFAWDAKTEYNDVRCSQCAFGGDVDPACASADIAWF